MTVTEIAPPQLVIPEDQQAALQVAAQEQQPLELGPQAEAMMQLPANQEADLAVNEVDALGQEKAGRMRQFLGRLASSKTGVRVIGEGVGTILDASMMGAGTAVSFLRSVLNREVIGAGVDFGFLHKFLPKEHQEAQQTQERRIPRAKLRELGKIGASIVVGGLAQQFVPGVVEQFIPMHNDLSHMAVTLAGKGTAIGGFNKLTRNL